MSSRSFQPPSCFAATIGVVVAAQRPAKLCCFLALVFGSILLLDPLQRDFHPVGAWDEALHQEILDQLLLLEAGKVAVVDPVLLAAPRMRAALRSQGFDLRHLGDHVGQGGFDAAHETWDGAEVILFLGLRFVMSLTQYNVTHGPDSSIRCP